MAFVQFSSADEVSVISVFAVPQDEKFYPYQGEVPEDDPRLLAYIEASAPLPLILAPIEVQTDEQGDDRGGE